MSTSTSFTIHCDGEGVNLDCSGWVMAPPLGADGLARRLRAHGWTVNDRMRGFRVDLCPAHAEELRKLTDQEARP